MVRLGYHRFVKEREQPSGEKFYSVELATAQSLTIESFTATPEESDLLEELRQVASFTKLAEKMRTLSKKVRPELWLQLDRYLTQAVVRARTCRSRRCPSRRSRATGWNSSAG